MSTDVKKRRIVITGMGVLSPVGIGAQATWKGLLNGNSGVSPISLFDASNYETKIAAEVKDFKPTDFMLPKVYRKTDRFAQLGVAAAKLAIEDANLDLNDSADNTIPVIMGSGLGGSLFHEEQIFQLIEKKEPRRVLASSVPRIAPNAVSAYIAMEFNLKGPNFTVSTACSSGGNAIAIASMYLKNGISDIVVTGGVECPITPFTYAAYQSLSVLSKEKNNIHKTPRPFDKDRDGFVLGEGGAVLILEELNHAKSRGAKIYGELLGHASNCGAYHMASPMPEGTDAADAISKALLDAHIAPEQVDYINAHGTATKMNDLAESLAINKVFGEGDQAPHVSSTKSQIGHTIGAAGALEACFTLLAIHDNKVPPNINCDTQDEACHINVAKNKAIDKKIKYAITNSFGFGSNNSVLVFGAEEG